MRVTIVDENDNPIGAKERNEILPSDIYRVSSLWIENSRGEVLLAQRSFNKKNDPGKWGPAVAGTVEEDETYESNIVKEIEEELGLTNIKFETGPKRFQDGEHRYFSQKFIAKLDMDINKLKIQEDEVEAVKWFGRGEIKELLNSNPDIFIPSMGKYSLDFL